MQWQKHKSLDYLCQMSPEGKAAVIFFHGYGADAQDLAGLAPLYPFSEQVDWFFPQGVLSVPISPMMSGRAWFELRVSDFERLQKGQLEDPPIDSAATKTLDLVADWLNQLGKRYDQIFIGGFSQGAILTSHMFYRLHFKPAGLVLFSGYLMHPSQFPTLAAEQCPDFYQSHGSQDMVLPLSGGQKLYEKLKELGLKGTWQQFGGGHDIPAQVIQGSSKFLSDQLKL